MVPSGKISLSVRSRVTHVDLVQGICDVVAKFVGFEGDDALNLGLAVREATINAMKHGNGMDPRKSVRVVFEFDQGGMSVAIRDSGRGFDPASVADPTLPENLFRSSGRGVLLMKSFVDRIEVHRDKAKGSEVCLFKCFHEEDAGRRRG